MTIATRAQVIATVDRALALDPARSIDAALDAAAQALGLPVEAVEEAYAVSDEEMPS